MVLVAERSVGNIVTGVESGVESFVCNVRSIEEAADENAIAGRLVRRFDGRKPVDELV